MKTSRGPYKTPFPPIKNPQTKEIQSKHTFILLWKILSFTQDNTFQNPLKFPAYTLGGGGGLRLTMIRYNINTLWHSFMTHENSKESEKHIKWSDMIANLSQSSIAGKLRWVTALFYRYSREAFPPSRFKVFTSIEITASASSPGRCHVESHSSAVRRNRNTANFGALWDYPASVPGTCQRSWWGSRTRSPCCNQSKNLLAKIVYVTCSLESLSLSKKGRHCGTH